MNKNYKCNSVLRSFDDIKSSTPFSLAWGVVPSGFKPKGTYGV